MMSNETYRALGVLPAKPSQAAMAGSIWPLRASLAASNRLLESLERPKSSDNAPGEPDRQFSTILGRFWL